MQTGYPQKKNHKEDKDEEKAGMHVNVNTVETATNIPECMKIFELQHKTALRQSFTSTGRMYDKRMAREQRQYSTEPQAILDILR